MSVGGISHKWEHCISSVSQDSGTISEKRQKHWEAVVREGQRKIISSGHDRTATFKESKQPLKPTYDPHKFKPIRILV